MCLTSILKTARVLPPASNFLPSRAFEVSKLGLDQPKPSRNIQYLFDHPTPPIICNILLAFTRITPWSEWTYEHRI